ncbi:phage major capsid protein [Microbacterium aurugineum]|uniref:phage major capsid protein n=1 Tax=Microbacterium aurugineum TaxID=2851642 RepID=UPI0039BE3809
MGFNPKTELAAINARFNVLSAKGADNLTEAEVTELEGMSLRAGELKAAIARGETNAALMGNIGGSGNAGPDAGLIETGERKGFLDFTPDGIKSFADAMVRDAREAKALFTGGSTATQVPLSAEPLRLPVGGLALLSALPAIQRTTPSWKENRQTVRTNGVAVVAPGGTKPQSEVTIETVDGALKVFATVTPGYDKFVLRDSDALTRFIQSELVYMVGSAIQDDAIDTILGTSGITPVTAASEAIVSVRKGIKAIEDQGLQANLIVLHSDDYFDIVTTRNAGGTFDVSNGVGAASETPRLWGVPVVSVTYGLTPGEALVLDKNAVAVNGDTHGVEVEWNPYAGWTTNTVSARSEARASTSVFRPSAIAQVELSAA